MSDTVAPIPEGFHTVTPYLILQGAAEAVEFYKKAFNAEETMRLETPTGKIGHAEIMVGNAPVMLADEDKEMGFMSPSSLEHNPVSFVIYVEDADALFSQAQEAGAVPVNELENKFYGDRMGSVKDPYGYVWHIASRIENLSAEEVKKRMDELYGG